MKSRWKGALIGGIIGLILAITKIIIGGGTFLEFSQLEIIYTLFSFPIYGIVFGLLMDKLKVFEKWYGTIYVLIISSFFIILYPLILQILNKGSIKIISPIFSFSFLLVIESILITILGTIILIIYFLFRKKNKVFYSLNMILVWFTGIFFLINDMGENFNIGGANGNWYLYGDYLLLIGIIIIICWELFKK